VSVRKILDMSVRVTKSVTLRYLVRPGIVVVTICEVVRVETMGAEVMKVVGGSVVKMVEISS